jgi:hypothetical protein
LDKIYARYFDVLRRDFEHFASKEMKKVISAKANDGFTLDLQFNDGAEKRFDVKPYLAFSVFRELKIPITLKILKSLSERRNGRTSRTSAPKLCI